MKNKADLDLSKPFFEVIAEDDKTITYASNQPNDQIGDQAFEWDLDGAQRKRWQERMAELERLGTRGDLVYIELNMFKDAALDNVKSLNQHYPLESYKMLILDLNDGNNS